MDFNPLNFGYPSLFLLALVNQLILPAPVDLIMLGLIKAGLNIWAILIVGVLGMTAGSTFDYLFGRYGLNLIPWIRKEEQSKGFKRARKFFTKHGQISLLFTWVPFIGKYLPVIAGLMETPITNFYLFYISGKVIYYGVLIFALKSISLI
jgi:membrane protein YqaA with SNARE-associated domain